MILTAAWRNVTGGDLAGQFTAREPARGGVVLCIMNGHSLYHDLEGRRTKIGEEQ
ncbi:hypothetical protein [Methanoculleus frigidifontis]|uniref:hypothetical protein n=1 Tax=Methanoculleus frigidifontis TaxID=2584085 RepID=UPI00265B34F7|nr:hypothetical protein [Methanoculleus sp. FWC-SCC1]